MSAGFRVAGEVFWGTNGAVEACLEALADQASVQFGDADSIAVFFRRERDAFFTGAVTDLAPVLCDGESRGRLLQVLDGATARLLGTDVFTEHGRSWIRTVIGDLRQRVSELERT